MKIEVKRTEFAEARMVYTYIFDENELAKFNQYLTELFTDYNIGILEPFTMEEIVAYTNGKDENIDRFYKIYHYINEEGFKRHLSIEEEFLDWVNLTAGNQLEFKTYYNNMTDSETDLKILED